MKKFMSSFAVIASLAIALAIGIYIGGHLAQADPVPPDIIPKWNDFRDECMANNTRGELATAVPVEWLLYQSTRAAGKEEKDMYFIVRAKERIDGIEKDQIIKPGLYELHVQGFDAKEKKVRCFEDFPPITWP